MKRILFWGLSTFSALILLFDYHTSTAGPLATTSTLASPAVSSHHASHASSSGGSGSGGSGSGSGGGTKGASTSGTRTVTGGTAMTQYGPVQVQLTITNGQITKVNVLRYPTSTGLDYQINGYALPILISETKQAQSAQINMVSGATFTSYGYLQSLQSALDQAGL